MYYSRFFKKLPFFGEVTTLSGRLALLQRPTQLRQLISRQGPWSDHNNYIFNHFTKILALFAQHHTSVVKAFLAGEAPMDRVCQPLAHFCISQGVSLDRNKTLASFAYHNAITDNNVRLSLSRLPKQAHINFLGYGLGDAMFEKIASKWIVEDGIAEKVTLHGFDPLAVPVDGIHMLDSSTLREGSIPMFDVITAHWVLHHVQKKEARWQSFHDCIKQLSLGGHALIIEHGFFAENNIANIPVERRQFYRLLIGTFDTVANLALHPHWLKKPETFTIDYLDPKDLQMMIPHREINRVTIDANHVGPEFPKQTVISMTRR